MLEPRTSLVMLMLIARWGVAVGCAYANGAAIAMHIDRVSVYHAHGIHFTITWERSAPAVLGLFFTGDLQDTCGSTMRDTWSVRLSIADFL